MFSPNHNSFSNDSVSERLARLMTIETNQAQSLSQLPLLHPDLKAWIRHCYSEYSSLLHHVSLQSSRSASHTMRMRLAKEEIGALLFITKQHILSFYNDDEKRRRAFGIEGTLPRQPNEMIALAQRVAEVSAEHKAESVDYCLSDEVYQRLCNAIEEFHAAHNYRSHQQRVLEGTHASEDIRFREDTAKLRRLLASWVAAFGTTNPNIGIVGMVNAQRGKNSARPGVVHISFDSPSRSVKIDFDTERPEPTSYHTEFRPLDTSVWAEYAKGEAATLAVDARIADGIAYEFRARARNTHGYGKWSELLVVRAELLLQKGQ